MSIPGGAQTFTNPILGGDYPDPTIMREGEDFLKTYPVTAVLFLINAVMFLLTEFAGRPGSTDTMLRLGAAYTPYIRDGQYWRLITSCFLHFGIGK